MDSSHPCLCLSLSFHHFFFTSKYTINILSPCYQKPFLEHLILNSLSWWIYWVLLFLPSQSLKQTPPVPSSASLWNLYVSVSAFHPPISFSRGTFSGCSAVSAMCDDFIYPFSNKQQLNNAVLLPYHLSYCQQPHIRHTHTHTHPYIHTFSLDNIILPCWCLWFMRPS